MKPFKTVDRQDLAFFESVMPGRVFSGEAISSDYTHDEMTIYGHFAPEAVLQALTAQEISRVLAYCNRQNIAPGNPPRFDRKLRHAAERLVTSIQRLLVPIAEHIADLARSRSARRIDKRRFMAYRLRCN